MTIIDWIVAIIIVLSALWGYKKGLLKMVGSILAGSIALFSAFMLRLEVANLLYNIKSGLPSGLYILLGFIITFVGIFAVLITIVTIVYKIISMTPIIIIDKILGSVVSLLFSLILIFAIFYVTYQSGWQSKILTESISFKAFKELSPDRIWQHKWELRLPDKDNLIKEQKKKIIDAKDKI